MFREFCATRRVTIFLGLMCAALAQSLAGESWQNKPFTQWDEKEARRVTSKSPWGYTRLLQSSQGDVGTLSRSESLRTEEMEQAAQQRRSGWPDAPTSTAGPELRVGSGGTGNYDSTAGNRGRAESYRVFWYSSLRARQAIGRLRQLRGLNLEQELKSLESQCQKDYVIAISGPVVRFFRNVELEELRAKTFLVSKKDKHKKILLREYVPPKVLRFPMALFLFSREADGKPMLELKDDEACFLTEQGPVRVKVSFKLKEMVTDGKLDL